MPFVTGVILEGEQQCSFDEPSWTDVQNLLDGLLRFDSARADGSLTLEGPPNVQLSLTLGSNGQLLVNWHDWDTSEDWVFSSEGASGTIRVSDADYPAREFVDSAIAIAAARTFFETGTRRSELPWRKGE